jgi:two-component sensor histidine kinase
LDAVEIPLTLDLAIPFGLLANELISNCIKHGLPHGRPGRIHVSIERIPSAVRLVIEDNGIGLPENFDAAKCTSMGIKLAASLAHQLGGRLEFTAGGGCRVQADLTRLGVPAENGQHQVLIPGSCAA